MKARMDAEGLPYGERTMTYNSRLAQELGKWADTQPGGEAFHDAMFRAYFVEARDISQPAVLLEIAERVGLPGDAAREVLEKRTFKEAVDADWKLSRQYGITGVPTFVAGRYGVVGAQPYETLEALVKKARSASARPDSRSGSAAASSLAASRARAVRARRLAAGGALAWSPNGGGLDFAARGPNGIIASSRP